MSEPLVGVYTALSDAWLSHGIHFPTIGVMLMNPIWHKPAILWFIIAANKGQKKTAALQLLKKPLLDIEHREAEANQDNNTTDTPLPR